MKRELDKYYFNYPILYLKKYDSLDRTLANNYLMRFYTRNMEPNPDLKIVLPDSINQSTTLKETIPTLRTLQFDATNYFNSLYFRKKRA